MSRLPTSEPSWREMRLDEIGDLVSGGTPSTGNPDYWDGSIAWVTPADLSALRTRHLKTTERTLTERGLANGAARMLPARSLVVSSRAPIGHMALPLVDFCTNQGCKSIDFHDGHDPDFHFYNLRFHVRRLHDKGEGTTFAEISKTAMESVTVPVPTDENVQKTIARVLVKLDDAIEQTETLLAKQQRIKTGLMHDLLTRGLDAQGRLRDPSTHRFKQSLLGLIPEEWEVLMLSEIGRIVTGNTPSPSNPQLYRGDQLFITPADLPPTPGPIVATEKKLTDAGMSVARVIPPSSICVVCIGSTIGKVGFTCCAAATNQQINAVVPNDPTDADFLFWAVSHDIPRQLRVVTGLQAVPIVNKKQFASLRVRRPQCEKEAIRIADVLHRADDDIAACHQTITKLRRLKTGLMHDLLTGERSVTPLLATSPS